MRDLIIQQQAFEEILKATIKAAIVRTITTFENDYIKNYSSNIEDFFNDFYVYRLQFPRQCGKRHTVDTILERNENSINYLAQCDIAHHIKYLNYTTIKQPNISSYIGEKVFILNTDIGAESHLDYIRKQTMLLNNGDGKKRFSAVIILNT